MTIPLVKLLYEAREYYKNKYRKYANLTPEQRKEMAEHMEKYTPKEENRKQKLKEHEASE
jgi:hypothetical protein